MFKIRQLQCLALTVLVFGVHHSSLAQQSTAPGLQQRLGGLFSSPKEEELLEPDQPFKLKVAFKGPTTMTAELVPAKGYYLYRDRIRFTVKDSRAVRISAVKLPVGKIKKDPNFGAMEIYDKPVQAEIVLDRAQDAKNFILAAAYQGCNEPTGVCYPPIDKELSLSLP